MARANDDIEQTLLEFADLLSILSNDPHKPRAYEKAARSVGGYHADVSTLDLKGILQIPERRQVDRREDRRVARSPGRSPTSRRCARRSPRGCAS